MNGINNEVSIFSSSFHAWGVCEILTYSPLSQSNDFFFSHDFYLISLTFSFITLGEKGTLNRKKIPVWQKY